MSLSLHFYSLNNKFLEKLLGNQMKKLLINVLLLCSISFAQSTYNWQNYSDLKDIRDFVFTNDGIWAASSGGSFNYNFSEKKYQTFGKAEGLLGNDLNAITIDSKNKIWFGSKSGMIDVLNLNTNKFSYISDIFNSDKINKGINYFFLKGDTVFVATDYGISLINTNNYFFYDSYFKLGTFSSNQKVNKVFYYKRVYAITNDGIAIQKQNATNLSAPESWDVFTNSSIGVTRVNDLVNFNDEIIIATNTGCFKFNSSNQNWVPFISELNSVAVFDLEVFQDKLFILSANKIYQFNSNNLTTLYVGDLEFRKILFNSSFDLAASSNKGIFSLKENKYLLPNGPVANQFANMIVDQNGHLWVATGKDGIGKGIMKFNGKEWNNINRQNNPNLLTDDYYSIFSAGDDIIYAGSWGSGFTKIGKNKTIRFDVSNTPMVGIPGDSSFLVITGLANDSKKNLWILNHWAGDGNQLAMLTTDSSWYLFKVAAAQGRALNKLFNLVIDQYDTKWFLHLDAGNLRGIFYFNENKTLNNLSDDKSGILTEANGLNSTDIYDIKIDKRGDIWVGSSRGANIISNISSVVNQANPQFRVTSVFPLRQQIVKAIAVDPLNQKWIATAEGLLLVSSDGSKVLANLNSKNSPLLDDRIESLTVDEKTGKVYVGTSFGLNIFETPAIKPKDKFEGLFIYPNPFVIKDGSQLITIDGLVRDSEIKILSISGYLVRKLETPGGRVAYWDGRDNQGNLVNSGIYLVVASDREGNEIEVGKVVIIKQ